jgi:hypothetical protein
MKVVLDTNLAGQINTNSINFLSNNCPHFFYVCSNINNLYNGMTFETRKYIVY